MNPNMITVLASIISAILGALISGAITLKVERRKIQWQAERDLAVEEKDEYEKRPRLELVSFRDLSEGNVKNSADLEAILLNFKEPKEVDGALVFEYDEQALKKENLVCVEYEFANTGKTEIDSVCLVSTHQKTTSLMELDQSPFVIVNHLNWYEAWSRKRFIKPGDKILIKVCYIKGAVMFSPISCMVSMYLEDINGKYWKQPLFCPTNETDNSTKADYKEFRENKDPKSAIECFKHPELW